MLRLPLLGIALALILWGGWQMWASGGALPEADTEALRSDATRIGERFGVTIAFASVDAFQEALSDVVPKATLAVTPADPGQASIALAALEHAMSIYPKRVLTFQLGGVFLASRVLVDEQYSAGATYTDRAIYIATDYIKTTEDGKWVEKAFHHELSSFFYFSIVNDSSPDARAWDAHNPPGFRYLEKREAQLEAAMESPNEEAEPEWYAQGFVSQYGRSSKENDINTYAELMMTEPARLLELSKRWPRIREKSAVLARYYALMDPALEAYLRSTPAAALLDSTSAAEGPGRDAAADRPAYIRTGTR